VCQVFSFKVRGAFNKLAQLSQEELDRGVICASAGNHAQGVALAARTLVISLTIFSAHQPFLIRTGL
jgi:threonine dehydratase